MKDNPYASPSSSLQPLVGPLRRSEANGPFALLLTMVLPAVFLWGLAASWRFAPRLPMEHFWFEVAFTLLVFLLPLAALPFAIAGLRTSHRRIAILALFLGIAEAGLIYYTKFHPWVLRIVPF